MSSPSDVSPPSPSPSSVSYNSSLLVIVALLVSVCVFTAALHILIRLLSPSSESDHPSSSLHHSDNNNRFDNDNNNNDSDNTAATSIIPENGRNRKTIIDSLPLFTLSSLPPLSPPSNCTICLSKFEAHDKLCVLPACNHTFHSLCINTWIMSTPSCPLCRSSIQIQCIISEPPNYEVPLNNQEQQQGVVEDSNNNSMRVSSWLKEYVDRLAISASSSFNSMRFSAWGSRRFDGEASAGGTATTATPSSLELGDSFRIDSGYFAASYKWILTGEA